MKPAAQELAQWYNRAHRDLPWRETTDPYAIWLSEIILQQTRVQTAIGYYFRFLDAFPTILDLANAEEAQVLRQWQGLGYYSRARNLHKAAKKVVADYQGRLPNTREALLTLPGLGPYTAAAVASFAFGEAVPALDGNGLRVLARLHAVGLDILSGKGRKVLTALAEQMIPTDDPATFNQALIELGAMVCLPKNPNCDQCPWAARCEARAKNLTDQLPVRKKAAKPKVRYLHYLICEREGALWVGPRPAGDIWQGLYDAPWLETDRQLTASELAEQLELSGSPEPLGQTHHILSHQRLEASYFRVAPETAVIERLAGDWVDPEALEALPKSQLFVRFLRGL